MEERLGKIIVVRNGEAMYDLKEDYMSTYYFG